MPGSRSGSLVLLILLLAAACGDDGPEIKTSLTQAEAELLGGMADLDLNQRLSALEAFQVDLAIPIPDPGCQPAASDPSNTDSDGDGIPDDQTLTYTDANCPGQSGTVRTQDTDGGSTLFGYKVTFTQYTLTSVSRPGPPSPSPAVVSTVTDGFFSATVTAGGATSRDALVRTFHISTTRDLSLRNDWTATFTPTTDAMDPSSGEFPHGSFVIQGEFDWSGVYDDLKGPFNFEMTTPDPLIFDPACPGVFRAGELRYGLAASGKKTGFLIGSQGCSVFIDITAFDER